MSCITNLEEILQPHLNGNVKISEIKINNLTSPGENFGSVMLKADVKLTNFYNNNDDDDDEKGGRKEEILHVVTKKLPTLEILREIFNIQVTFRNEIAFYDTILPTLNKFLKENHLDKENLMDCFAKFYGGRINLDKNNKNLVDDDAVLVLENLITSGYSNADRLKGFDWNTTKRVIKDISTFHAINIALKMKHPEIFEKNIKPNCYDYIPKPEISVICREAIKEILKEKPECHRLINKVTLWGQGKLRKSDGIYTTLCHCDLWVNNTMQKYENGILTKNKFVDFQVYSYRSCASDLFFLLWSSVELTILKDNLDDLIKFYYENLIGILKKFHCDVSPFTYESFLKEIELESDFEFGHAMQFSTFVVQGKKGSQLSEVPTKEKFLKNLTRVAKERVWYMSLECEKRNWLH